LEDIDKFSDSAQDAKLLKQLNQFSDNLPRVIRHLTSTIAESALTLMVLSAMVR
jgi:hypothetical protein